MKGSLDDLVKLTTDNDLLIYVGSIISALIISFCVYLKVPQIQNIRRNRNANGVCLPAVLLEITGYTITTLYNYTNSYSCLTYLEYPIILTQLYVLVAYILKYGNQLSYKWAIIMAVMYIAIVYSFAVGLFPKYYMARVLPLTTPISGFSKLTYIYGIIHAGNADSVSRLTWIFSIGTNAGRIFTVIMDSADFMLLLNFTISTLLSVCVLATAIYYQTCAHVEGPRYDVVREADDHDHVD